MRTSYVRVNKPVERLKKRKGHTLLYLKDTDAEYHRLKENWPVRLVNTTDLAIEEQRASLVNQSITVMTEAGYSSVPSCACGKIVGRHHEGVFHDVPNCNSYVMSRVGEFRPLLWVKKPIGVEKMLSIGFLKHLRMRYASGKFSAIDYLLDTNYNVIPQKRELAARVKARLKRGYNVTVTNMETVIEELNDIFRMPAKVRDTHNELFKEEKDRWFCDYFPLPANTGVVMEATFLGRFVSSGASMVPELITWSAGIDLPDVSQNQRERRLARTQIGLCELLTTQTKKVHQGKYGGFRRHGLGGKKPFGARLVLTPIVGKTEYDAVHLPWMAAIEVYRYQLISKLLHQGYDIGTIFRILKENSYNVSEDLWRCGEELIEDAGGSLPCTHTRNPSLTQGATQTGRITRFKRDLRDVTASTFYGTWPPMNADGDGDTIIVQAIPDKWTAENIRYLDTAFSALSLTTPRALSGNVKLPAPSVAVMTAYYEDRRQEPVNEAWLFANFGG